MFNFMVTHFKSYAGWGLIFFYYLAVLIWLLISEKRKERRILFVYMPLIILAIFFNPFAAKAIVKYADESIYYRFLWILPVTATISYALTEMVVRFKGKVKASLLILSALFIMVGGRLVYTDERFSVAENEYHVPQAVADICDEIVIPGREIRAAFPEELLVYIRQYTPLVVMPYGWDDIKNSGGFAGEELRDLINSEDTTSAEDLSRRGRETECHYLILSEEKPLSGDMTERGYEEFAHMGGYVIFKNPEMDFTVP